MDRQKTTEIAERLVSASAMFNKAFYLIAGATTTVENAEKLLEAQRLIMVANNDLLAVREDLREEYVNHDQRRTDLSNPLPSAVELGHDPTDSL